MTKKILLFIEGIMICLYQYYHFVIPCFFKSIFHIPCPGCGMTRAFKEIIHFHFRESFKYNILGLPFFITLLIINILLIYDILLKKDLVTLFLKQISKYILIIILLIIISWGINIYHGI